MSEKNIKKFQKADIRVVKAGAEIITFKDKNINRVQILTCKDGKTTINGKLKDTYDMKAIDLDDGVEKDFNVASSRLNELLSDINIKEGLIGQKLRIEAIGSGVGRTYKVEKITN